MNFRIKKISGVLFMTGMVALAGCSHPKVWVYDDSPKQTAARQHTVDVLRANGVQVFTQGESVKMILPSSSVFNTNSADLLDQAKPLLTQIAVVIKSFSVVNVAVNVYADARAWEGDPASRNDKLILTNQQSQVIEKYLWSQGINTRFLSAEGQGDASPVAWNGTPKGRSFNRRVEITFNFTPHLVSYN